MMIMKWIPPLAITALLVASTTTEAATPDITSIEAAPDSGIRIRWSSEAGKIYRIEYVPALTPPIQWRELYSDYPS